MAEKYWDNSIDKHTDWGGDESTNNLPVSGGKVQEFIRETLEQKMGVIHYDAIGNRYLVFADSENRDLYLADPVTYSLLLIGTFDAPANYSAEIFIQTPLTQSIQKGKENIYIEFTFDIKNKSGASIGEPVICTYTITGADGKHTVRETYNPGTNVRFLMDDYLSTGVNNITITVMGSSTLAATTSGIVINIIELLYTPTFNFQTAVSPNGTLTIPYMLSGPGIKYIEWYIDGEMHGSEDAITDVTANRTKYIELAEAEPGLHTLQTRTYVISQGDKFYTDTHYWEFAVTGGSEIIIMIDTIVEIPVTTAVEIKGEQYKGLSFDWAIYDPQAKTREVVFTLAGTIISTIEASSNDVRTFSYFPVIYGQNTLYINCDTVTRVVDIYITQSKIGIQEATVGRLLKLAAFGRSNADVNKSVWTDNGYSTTFNGFSWNENQGWNNGALAISKGANIEIDIRPLAINYAETGGTIEIEFETTVVEDEEAVLCECLDEVTGAGIIIRATSATIQSSGGAKVTTRFNVGDRIKLAFIVNKTSGTEFSGLALIANNGMLERATNYSPTDSFVCNETLKIGDLTGKTSIRLYTIRVYDRALTAEEEFGNYVLDSDNINKIVEKNDIFIEGTTLLSVEKIASKIPVMIITADLDTLMASMDKSLSVYGDIEYINNQDPTKSFTTQGSRIRLQGTSSLGYPRKNYRFYTTLGKYGTILDYQGNQLPEGKYAFKDGSLPVDLWCLKADYAESSMAHNTGVARLWNDLLRDVIIDGQFRCRTQAQQVAISNGYPYDIRTAIDGFPIVCFYRQTYNDDLICLGQYNFNNDKKNEAVFGYKDLPGFDNSRVEGWEMLNNTHPLTTFTSLDNFDQDWEDAFEARYPDDGSDADTTHLKNFIGWSSTTSREAGATYGETLTIAAEIKCDTDTQYGAPLQTYVADGVYPDTPENRLLKFQKEKWDHLDVFKMAAYYIYLMRFGAVDQVVKNAMFTTEGTQGVGTHSKWFFVHYDNDTIIGTRNDARLIFDYYIDRQTLDPTLEGVYAYMGHDSTLWNNLEADEEFMRIVQVVDKALYGAGLTYENCIKMFEEKQINQWSERLYNENSKYKYIQPFYESGTNNLFMLQGARKSFRHWWLKNRFDIYDAKWVSGAYSSKVIEFKAPGADTSFSITAGKKLEYGYLINNIPMEANVELDAGESHTFVLPRELAIGDPVRVCAITSVRALDLSPFKTNIAQFNMQLAYDDDFGSLFKKLILGDGEDTQNTALTDVSGLSSVISMEYLDIRGFAAITSLNISTLINLKTFLATGSGLTSFIPSKGNYFDQVSLPLGIQAIEMDQVEIDDFQYLPTTTLRVLSLKNVEGFNVMNFVYSWYAVLANSGNPALLQNASLTFEGIYWLNMPVSELIKLSHFGTYSLKGYVKLTSLSFVEMQQLISAFGENIFLEGGEFIIDAPTMIQLSGEDEIVSGSTVQYTTQIFPITGETHEIKYSIMGVTPTTDINGDVIYVKNNSTLYEETGLLVTQKNYLTDDSFILKAEKVGDSSLFCQMTVSVKRIVIPSQIEISGSKRITTTGQFNYSLAYSPTDYTGEITNVYWSTDADPLVAQISTSSYQGCTINVNSITGTEIFITLSVEITFENGTTLTDTITIGIVEAVVIMTSISNPRVLAICYAQGWCASPNSMTNFEAEAVTDIGTVFRNSNITHFEEFQYFTGVESIEDAFSSCYGLTSINIPSSVTQLKEACFSSCRNLTYITIPDSVTSFGGSCFNGCESLVTITIPDSVTTIGYNCFEFCTGLTSIAIPDSVTYIGDDCFAGCESLTTVTLSSNLTQTGGYCFAYCYALASINIPDSLTSLKSHFFYECESLQSVIIPNGITSLDMRCFHGCVSLQSISMSASMSSLGYGCFYGCLKLSEIVINRINAPTVTFLSTFGDSISSYVGRDSYNLGTNILYVPQGATGYNSGMWLNPLQHADKCGFTISYTL